MSGAERTARRARGSQPGAPPLVRGGDVAWLAYLLVALLVARWVPERWLPKVAGAFARAMLRLRPARAARERLALGRLLGREPSALEGMQAAYRTHLRLALLQVLRARRPGAWAPPMRLEGEEHLRAALAQGRGAVLWVPPFVHAALMSKMILHAAGYRVAHLSRYLHGGATSRLGARFVNPLLTGVEARYLDERVVIGPDGATHAVMRKLIGRLGRNGLVSITVGTEGTQLVEVPFLKGRLAVATGAPALAQQTGAPLLPVVTWREPDGGFVGRIEPPLEAGRHRGDHAEAVARLARVIARHVERRPEQFGWHAALPWLGAAAANR